MVEKSAVLGPASAGIFGFRPPSGGSVRQSMPPPRRLSSNGGRSSAGAGGAIGKQIVNVVPLPGSDATVIVPPFFLTNSRTISRPMPRPSPFVEPTGLPALNTSTIFDGMPGPESAILISTTPSLLEV